MNNLDKIFNIADAKNFSWWEKDISDQEEEGVEVKPDADDNGNEGKDVDSDKKGVKDPQPDTHDNSIDKGDGKEDITSTEEGVKDPQPTDCDDSDFIETDAGFHQSNYHSLIDDYTEYDWPI